MLCFRKYPSTTAMQCFETAARHLRFTKAAQELHMTQSAVSKQVAQLEDLLQLQLFERSSQSLYLTPVGKKFYIEIENILKQIELSTIDVMAHGAETETLNLVSHPTFCARWLVPALKGFGKANPKIHLDIKEMTAPFFLEDHNIDAAFLHGDGVWTGMKSILLFDEEMVAVCRPDYLKQPLQTLSDISQYILLQSNSRPSAWHYYFQAQNVCLSGSFIGPRFETFYTCIAAAENGCGIALVPKIMVQKELDSGQLVKAWHYKFKGMGGYYLAYPCNKESTPKVKIIIQWIKNYLEKTANEKMECS